MKNRKLKLAVIGTVGVPAKYGGFETLVHHLVTHLHNRFDITVYASGAEYPPEDRVRTWRGARVQYIPLKANGLQSIPYDLWSMMHALLYAEVLLVLGVSGCIFLPLFKLLFPKKKIIVNIDGLEWRRPKWNWFAKRFLLLSEYVACKFADEIITDNRILEAYAKIRYNIQGRLIEYGADHVSKVPVEAGDLEKYPFLGGEYAFKVARIEPENHLHLILEAYAELPDEQLVIVGNWKNSQYGTALLKRYAEYANIELLDPIYDPRELNLLRSNASLYLHGHSAGGTNPSLVEAMYLQLPVLCYDVIYNRVTTNNQAIYFSTADELRRLVLGKNHLPLYATAENLKVYADKCYTWATITRRYADLLSGKQAVLLPDLGASQQQYPQPARAYDPVPRNLSVVRFSPPSSQKNKQHVENRLIANDR
ncbi:MAG: DUF1972 domain-containing protein [Bacteroidota bacterium]